MRISDWSSDVCSSDLILRIAERGDFRGDLGAFGIGLRPAALEITGLGVDLADREADAHVPTRRFEVPPRGRASLGVVGVEQALVHPALTAGRQYPLQSVGLRYACFHALPSVRGYLVLGSHG